MNSNRKCMRTICKFCGNYNAVRVRLNRIDDVFIFSNSARNVFTVIISVIITIEDAVVKKEIV